MFAKGTLVVYKGRRPAYALGPVEVIQSLYGGDVLVQSVDSKNKWWTDADDLRYYSPLVELAECAE